MDLSSSYSEKGQIVGLQRIAVTSHAQRFLVVEVTSLQRLLVAVVEIAAHFY